MQAWPIPIETVSYAVAGTVLWRHVGRVTLTVVVKVKLTLDDGLAKLASVEEIVCAERFLPQSRSVSDDVDIAPYKPRAEVTFVGSAWCPNPADHVNVRLGVQGEGAYFDKMLQVIGDRAGPNAPPTPFQRMPLMWDRTWGENLMNPVGVDRSGRRWPNILNPQDPNSPAGFGPLSRSWQARGRFLRGGDPRTLEGAALQMPNELSWGYFLAAPQDQQLEKLRGNEVIFLENMIEGRPRVRSQLPGPIATARLYGPTTGASGHAIDLKIDTLAINGDRRCVYLVWRGTTPFDEAAANRSRVVTNVELPNTDESRAKSREATPSTQRVPAITGPPERIAGKSPMATSLVGNHRALAPTDMAPPVVAKTLHERPLAFSVPKVHDDGKAMFDLDEPDSSAAGSTMALDPDAAMKMLAEARAALPFENKLAPPSMLSGALPRGPQPPAPPAPLVAPPPHPAQPPLHISAAGSAPGPPPPLHLAPAGAGNLPPPVHLAPPSPLGPGAGNLAPPAHFAPPAPFGPPPLQRGAPQPPIPPAPPSPIARRNQPPQPPAPLPPPPLPPMRPPMAPPVMMGAAAHDAVVRPPASYSMTDDDSVGSTMAITPEAAAQLLSRQTGPQPAAQMAVGGPPKQPQPPASPTPQPPAPQPPPPQPLVASPPPRIAHSHGISPASMFGPASRGPAKTIPPNVPPPAPPPPLPLVVEPRRHGTLEMNKVPDDDDDDNGGGTVVIQNPNTPPSRKRGRR